MNSVEFINNAIKEIVIGNIRRTCALIIFNDEKAALIMPTGGIGSDGKRYRIWSNLSSLEEAELAAREWGSKMPRVDIVRQREDDIPEDPENMLCNYFLMKFA